MSNLSRSVLSKISGPPAWVVPIAVLALLVPMVGVAAALPEPAAGTSQAASTTPAVLVAAAPPAGSVGSLRITVHNPGGVATGSYDQPVSIDSSAHADLINSNWTNGVPYYTANATPIHGWLEANASNASPTTLLWLRLASIPAGGWTNVSIYFWPKSSFNLSTTGYIGEAPELSSPYGAFDNGATVFNFYDNFAASPLGAQWDVGGGWAYTVGDGFTVDSVPGGGGAIMSRTSYAYPAVVDFYGNLFETNGASTYLAEGFGSSICIVCANESDVGWATPHNGSGPVPLAAAGTTDAYGDSPFATQRTAVFTTEAVSGSSDVFQVNYSAPQTLTTDIPPSPLPIGLAVTGASSGPLTNATSTYWIRERSYVAITPTYAVADAYTVSFTASGLPAGADWNVTFGDLSQGATSPAISFEAAVGAYSFTVGAPSGYLARPSGAVVAVTGPASVSVAFAATYTLTFAESGLPAGTSWWVAVNGTVETSNSTTIGFVVPAGAYAYVVGAVSGYLASPAGGSVTENGTAQTVPIAYSAPSSGQGPAPVPSPPASPGLSSEALALLAGGVVAALVVGLVIGYAVRGRSQPPRPPA